MKNGFFLGLYIFISIFILSSCSPKSGAQDLLEKAKDLAENRPDSAVRFIDSILTPLNSLDKELYMEYLVTKVQLYYKNSRDITQDTLIFEAKDYFDETGHNNSDMNFLSHFYSGCLHRENNHFDKAIIEYKCALSIAEREKMTSRQGLVFYNIGDLYFERRSYSKALQYYQSAIINYQSDPTRQLFSLQSAGQACLLKGEIDSAFMYFDSAIDLSRRSGDKSEEAGCLQNKAVALYEQGNYKSAIPLFLSAKNIDPEPEENVRYNLNLARAYNSLGKQDSSEFYTNELKSSFKKIENVYFKKSAAEFLANRCMSDGNYTDALQYLHLKDSCLQQIMDITNVHELALAEQRYDMASKEMQLAITRGDNYRLGLIIVTISLFSAIVTAVSIYFGLKQKSQKYELAKQEDEIQTQKREFNELQQEKRKNEFINSIFRNYISNIASFKYQINNIVVGYSGNAKKDPAEGFAKIKKNVDSMENGIQKGYSSIISDYFRLFKIIDDSYIDQLKSEEKLLLTLICEKYGNSEIAGLLQIKSHALTVRKSRLKDKLQKLGVSEDNILEIFSTSNPLPIEYD